jgi:hypothetical protein
VEQEAADPASHVGTRHYRTPWDFCENGCCPARPGHL